ncbi:hypothetical protein IQ265_04010 [Nodosilinea sp. LEGE 06152]|uniref:hypothetical protein n=1 Tax=Nodosilinea sp. LEGE 06152 TaxID=2777966 RepID=UPI00187E3A85|nr:hypothetical protein [Nodosilinea sp. LEGE 06152]MBE9156000.1 hypothetical protein [Nodosilinea sp. LEGE 06152]
MLISFIMNRFADQLKESGRIISYEPCIRQVLVEREDCKDIFDFLLEIELEDSSSQSAVKMELWGQVTCYKGNKLRKPEPNKTYEIRETIVEGLGLRRSLQEQQASFRTIHITVGPTDYTYGWFADAKRSAYDLSLYPSAQIDSQALFKEMNILSSSSRTEEDYDLLLANIIDNSDSQVGKFIAETLNELCNWFNLGMPISQMADAQSVLLDQLYQSTKAKVLESISASKRGGKGIKDTAKKVLLGEDTADPLMLKTMSRLWSGNPFLQASLEAESSWENWVSKEIPEPEPGQLLEQYICTLWRRVDSSRLILRRLLLRIHSKDTIEYIQDTDITGLTEHNLYGGAHSASQSYLISSYIATKFLNSGIDSPEKLKDILKSRESVALLKASRRFEAGNGTNIKPSFFYVEEALSDQYDVVDFERTNLEAPISYYKEFGSSSVKPYQNMKVICDKRRCHPIAILKAKYFRNQEFARRAKEESFVGITTKYKYVEGEFLERYQNIPLIMFVDMSQELVPPAYAVCRLVTAGWDVYFSIQELKNFLSQLNSIPEEKTD